MLGISICKLTPLLLPEVTFKLSTGTKGVSVALDEPDVTGGSKGQRWKRGRQEGGSQGEEPGDASPLHNGAFVLYPEAGAPLMGLDGALGETLYVLGQHLFLPAVGCIRLGVSRGRSASRHPSVPTPVFAAQRDLELATLSPQPALPWPSPGAPPPSGG